MMARTGAWTREEVEALLVGAFRDLPQCPVFAFGRTVQPLAADAASLAMSEVLNWAEWLRGDPDGRTYLWSWARCRARRDSFGALCREMGWPRATAEDGRRRAAKELAKRLNAGVALAPATTAQSPNDGNVLQRA